MTILNFYKKKLLIDFHQEVLQLHVILSLISLDISNVFSMTGIAVYLHQFNWCHKCFYTTNYN